MLNVRKRFFPLYQRWKKMFFNLVENNNCPRDLSSPCFGTIFTRYSYLWQSKDKKKASKKSGAYTFVCYKYEERFQVPIFSEWAHWSTHSPSKKLSLYIGQRWNGPRTQNSTFDIGNRSFFNLSISIHPTLWVLCEAELKMGIAMYVGNKKKSI